MRQQHSAFFTKTSRLHKKEDLSSFPVVMADSLEVMEYYYRGKLQEMEQSLSQLNLLENPREISSLCKEVIHTKEILKKIFLKKRA